MWGGTLIASFSLAVNSRRKGGEKETTWFNCVAFGKTGEAILANVTKGSQLAVTGKLKSREPQELREVS
jgi:single-strand DNA-binding protein